MFNNYFQSNSKFEGKKERKYSKYSDMDPNASL